MYQPPADSRAQSLAQLLLSCGFDFPKLPPAEKRLNWRRLQSSLIQWQLAVSGAKFTANRLQFMGYNVYGFSPAEFSIAFPDVANPLPAPLAPALAAAPTPAQIAVYNSQLTLYEAFVSARDCLKAMLEYFYRSEIEHLSHDLTGFSGVSCAQMHAAAQIVHGKLNAEDFARLRLATRAPPDRTITAEENISSWLLAVNRLTASGPNQAPSEGEKEALLTVLLNAMSPEIAAIVHRYHAETDTLARSCDSLLAAARLGLSRLPVQPSLAAYGRANVARSDTLDTDADDYLYVDSSMALAAVASTKGAAQPIITAPPTKAAKSTADLQKFYDSAPEGKYCFLHGYGSHTGPRCRLMTAPKSTFTAAQISLAKPKYSKGKILEVDGVLPIDTLVPGFRHKY
jgi:hypothetical protein